MGRSAWEEIGVNPDIVVMQVFSGLSLFTILLLMSLGLAIVFGLMGVINMAHGELMALGAYVTYMVSVFLKAFFHHSWEFIYSWRSLPHLP